VISAPSFNKTTLPESGFISPARIKSKVDLPEPFGPVMAAEKPMGMHRQISLKSLFLPKDLESEVALIVGLSPSIFFMRQFLPHIHKLQSKMKFYFIDNSALPSKLSPL
jgi:hypothetical protein